MGDIFSQLSQHGGKTESTYTLHRPTCIFYYAIRQHIHLKTYG